MEINKKQWYFHLGLLLVMVLMDLFGLCIWRQGKAFEEFSTPLNYNQIIMYTATLQRMLLIIILYVHTL
jgi:hypothetical protein